MCESAGQALTSAPIASCYCYCSNISLVVDCCCLVPWALKTWTHDSLSLTYINCGHATTFSLRRRLTHVLLMKGRILKLKWHFGAGEAPGRTIAAVLVYLCTLFISRQYFKVKLLKNASCTGVPTWKLIHTHSFSLSFFFVGFFSFLYIFVNLNMSFVLF